MQVLKSFTTLTTLAVMLMGNAALAGRALSFEPDYAEPEPAGLQVAQSGLQIDLRLGNHHSGNQGYQNQYPGNQGYQNQYPSGYGGNSPSYGSSRVRNQEIDLGRGTGLSYNAREGSGTFYDSQTGQVITKLNGWRTTWNSIVYLGENKVLFYERQSGEGEVYRMVPRRGEFTLLKQYPGWRKSWRKVFSPSRNIVKFVDFSGETVTFRVDNRGQLYQQ